MTDEELRLECLKLANKNRVSGFGEFQNPVDIYAKANEYLEYVKTGEKPILSQDQIEKEYHEPILVRYPFEHEERTEWHEICIGGVVVIVILGFIALFVCLNHA